MPDMTLPFAHVTSLADSIDVQAQEAREESRAQSRLADRLEQLAVRLRMAIKQDERNTLGKGANDGNS